MKGFKGAAALAGAAALMASGPAFADRAAAEKNLDKIDLPPGFEIEVYAEVPAAREMAIGRSMGTVFVGTRSDTVYAVMDQDKDYQAEKVVPFKEGLNAPSGVATHKGYLYVSERHRLTRYAAAELDIERRDFRPEVLYEGFLDNAHHGTRYTRFGPDGKVYVAQGVPCNICDPEGDTDAILRFDADGSNRTVYAEGIRNSVGLDFHPETGDLFFNDNGVDNMGDTSPPGEFNHATEAGLHFGFPYYAGGKDRHEDWQDKEPPGEMTFPVVEYKAHVAALGMTFYRGEAFPEKMHNDAFVAQHGSWNRSTPIGYRVMRIRFNDKGEAVGKEVFADGWLQNRETSWGRPVDVKQLPDGSLLVSDDYQGVIYRITYEGEG